MKNVIMLSQKKEWIAYLKRAVNYDFYQTWTYHCIDKSEGMPLLYVYEEGDDFIAFPLLKRYIPDSGCYDLGSVYGYSGPFASKNFECLDVQLIVNFRKAFLLFLQEENIVSVFSRLHPFFNQDVLMNTFGGVFGNGKVVVLDLGISYEEQQNGYQERNRRKIRQLRQKGFFIKEGGTEADIRVFAEIYTASMLRLEASADYFFDETYFSTLLNAQEFDARLLFVCDHSGYPVCGAIIVLTNDIIQAHLLGTREEYMAESPAKLLIDEITILGRKLGMKYYNLGGGLGFKEDSLFAWKATFSPLTLNYQSWRFIADQEEYNRILDDQDIDHNLDIDFFPLYRMVT